MKPQPPVGVDASVCALIPHYECEDLLEHALWSLVEQTRPPDAIVVIDDASTKPPTRVVRRFPTVTLLQADTNGGPYRLVQAVIDRTDFDAYVFQDADDWSAIDRLEVLLDVAASTGAELIGCHEVRVFADEDRVAQVRYPLDVSAALHGDPRSFPLLHPTSLISRGLVTRVGGFATGMRFSGDLEMLQRAVHVARVANADHFGYFRRKRSGSLTTAADTGLQSPRRRAVHANLAARATANAESVRGGGLPDLRPWRQGRPVYLQHVAGPEPRAGSVCVRRPRPARRRPDKPDRAPVFVVGAPCSGQAELGWALAQHPGVSLLPDPAWFAQAARDVELLAGDHHAGAPVSFRDRLASSLRALGWPAGGLAVACGSQLVAVAHALTRMWPDACFVHLVRDPDEVAATLAASPTIDGSFFTPDVAYERWHDDVAMGLALERRPQGRVLRLMHEQIRRDPGGALAELGRFLDLDLGAASVRTLEAFGTPKRGWAPEAAHEPVERARALWSRLVRGALDDAGAPDELERLFLRARSAGGRHGSFASKVRRISSAAPCGATIAVVSKGDPALLDLADRVGWHFPRTASGVYLGHHPADDHDVIEHLVAAQQSGASHLLVPATSFWWLEHYDGLRRYLDERCSLVAYEAGTGAMWSLSPVAATSEQSWLAPVGERA